MLTLFIVLFIGLSLFPSNILYFITAVFTCLVYYLTNLNFFFNSSLSVNGEIIINDEVSLFINLLLFFIIYISFLNSNQFKTGLKTVGLVFIYFDIFLFYSV